MSRHICMDYRTMCDSCQARAEDAYDGLDDDGGRDLDDDGRAVGIG